MPDGSRADRLAGQDHRAKVGLFSRGVRALVHRRGQLPREQGDRSRQLQDHLALIAAVEQPQHRGQRLTDPLLDMLVINDRAFTR